MQTKKVAMGRNSSKALASPKVSKTQKKVPEDVNNQENKASQMITSSARKKTRLVGYPFLFFDIIITFCSLRIINLDALCIYIFCN